MKEYTIEDYYNDIDKYGLKKTWKKILSSMISETFLSKLFVVANFGELYEIGLERENVIKKKEMGKYYTPQDVSYIMSRWLLDLDAENVCDVACGTGNLILSYLEVLGRDKAIELIEGGHLYLYDKDEIALNICKNSIALTYGYDLLNKINAKHCDFLDKKIKLPNNSKTICNPPYFKITEFGAEWEITNVIRDSKELYSSFIQKILIQSDKAVIITPYSYIGGGKFYSLRQFMNNYNGFVISFDNVPGNIFNGRKHGIFNSNKGNSVRAAIMVAENLEGEEGFKFSPLIRFKTDERKRMLNNKFLESLVPNEYQKVDSKNKFFFKCHIELRDVLEKWESNSKQKMGSIIGSKRGKEIFVPTTCRYFTVGSKRNLNRDGKRVVRVKDDEKYNFVYCMLNSSFAYWYWRLYDGGINCPLTIINNIPIFYDIMTEKQKKEIDKIAKEMQKMEGKYLSYKLNAGKKQENIKFPVEYRNRINKLFFEVLNIEENVDVLNVIHSSSLFLASEEEENE